MARSGAAAFAHLQVASSFSLQYGTATPAALAQYAAEFGHDIVGLTDRNGVYGAVRWVQACQRVGISSVLGVDLVVDLASEVATGSSRGSKRRTPAHGGGWVDEQRPRVVFLARGADGWASLCRLISAAHLDRGTPWLPWQAIQDNSAGVVALMGPDSALGRHFTSHGATGAKDIISPWREIFGPDLHIAIANHHRTGRHPYSKTTAARMLGWAVQEQIIPILTNAVRYLRSEDSRVADVLDAARQLVPLTSRQIELGNGSAAFKSTAAMNVIAEDIATAAGCGGAELLRNTRSLAESCVINGVRDLGLGEVYVPEREVLVGSAVEQVTAQAQLQWQCERKIPERYVTRAEQQLARDRLEDELRVIGNLGFAGYFLTVAEVVSMIKGRGVRVAARGSGAGCLVNHLLGISGVDPMRYGLLMERFLSPLRRVLPDIDIDVESARRLEVYDWIYERFGSERVACVSMMETYRVRHAVRDVGAALGLPPQEIDEFAKSFPHIRARDARSALRDLPELRSSGFGRLAKSGELDDFLGLVEALDGLPRNVAMHPCGVLLSDISLLNRTPVEPSAAGYPMSQ
ncbi:MAG: PHP domain-containing protein, partial [Actinobacteria bacterium]|nr:PHP domain-containing protein [Actinomycetota bacterium]